MNITIPLYLTKSKFTTRNLCEICFNSIPSCFDISYISSYSRRPKLSFTNCCSCRCIITKSSCIIPKRKSFLCNRNYISTSTSTYLKINSIIYSNSNSIISTDREVNIVPSDSMCSCIRIVRKSILSIKRTDPILIYKSTPIINIRSPEFSIC